MLHQFVENLCPPSSFLLKAPGIGMTEICVERRATYISVEDNLDVVFPALKTVGFIGKSHSGGRIDRVLERSPDKAHALSQLKKIWDHVIHV